MTLSLSKMYDTHPAIITNVVLENDEIEGENVSEL